MRVYHYRQCCSESNIGGNCIDIEIIVDLIGKCFMNPTFLKLSILGHRTLKYRFHLVLFNSRSKCNLQVQIVQSCRKRIIYS